jgi:mannobiose 2-epimerase
MAQEMFSLIEKHCHDDTYGGYFDAFNRDWSIADHLLIGRGLPGEKKTMNTHLHLLEAYTNLYRVWPDAEVRRALVEMIEIFQDRIVDGRTYQSRLYFDEKWHSLNEDISFGHDIEAGWLLCEAAEVLGDKKTIRELETLVVKMTQAVYEQGLDDDGAIWYEAVPGKVTNYEKHWWPQAEAVVGFLNAYQISGQPHYLNAAEKCWHFIETHLVDREYGGWYSKVTREGEPNREALKASEWKAPYHNGRACLEIIRRLETILMGHDK